MGSFRCRRVVSLAGDGVDLGVKFLAVLSTDETVANPRCLPTAVRRLRRAQRAVSRRRGPYDQATGSRRPVSSRYLRACARVTRVQARVANLRRDGLHKLTTRLSTTFGTIMVEDLHVAGMIRNRRLASSKTCSGCGAVKTRLALSERPYRCACGPVLDRDVNAARNLAALVCEAVDARSGRESLNGRGADRQTPRAGQTGTVLPQGRTSDHALTTAH